MDLSVVLAGASRERDVAPALSALERACAALTAEVVVVGSQPPPQRVTRLEVRQVAAPPELLVPEQWALGLQACRGELVGFITTDFRVSPGWARPLVQEVRGGAVGAAGAITLGAQAGPVATATYLLRYSAFAPVRRERVDARDIPGDAAVYRRDAILRHPDLLRWGFWEVEFHRRFLAQGEHLVLLPEVLATYHGSPAFVAMLQQRYRHGVEFGWVRVRDRGESRWRVLAAAPLVPLVLAARVARRVSRTGWGWQALARAAPALLPLASAWALGEVAGAFRSRRS